MVYSYDTDQTDFKQFPDWTGEGHLPGGEYHSYGDVYVGPENCGQNI